MTPNRTLRRAAAGALTLFALTAFCACSEQETRDEWVGERYANITLSAPISSDASTADPTDFVPNPPLPTVQIALRLNADGTYESQADPESLLHAEQELRDRVKSALEEELTAEAESIGSTVDEILQTAEKTLEEWAVELFEQSDVKRAFDEFRARLDGCESRGTWIVSNGELRTTEDETGTRRICAIEKDGNALILSPSDESEKTTTLLPLRFEPR